MSSHEARGFLRFGTVVCALGALFTVIDALLPQDHGVVDNIGDVVASIEGYLLIGLGWGFAAIRQGAFPKVAAALLLLVHVLTHVGLLGSHVLLLEVVPWLGALATSAFVWALVWQGPVRAAVVGVIAVGGAVVVAAAGWDGGVLRAAGLVTTSLALAALFELSRARPPAEDAVSTLGAWRQAEAGTRLLVMGEWGRVVVMLGALVIGLFVRAIDRGDLMLLVVLGSLVTLGISSVGLVQMRTAPTGRAWLSAALAMALVAMSAVALELLGHLLDVLPSFGGFGAIARLVGQGGVAVFAALGLGALGMRVGLATAHHEARETVRAYVIVFVLTFATLVMRDLAWNPGLVGFFGVVLVVLLVWAIEKLAALGKRVQAALPAGAADDLFGGELEGRK